MLCLVIVWCEKEPWRVGECAFFPPFKERWLGRGGDPIEDYASFARQLPGEPPPIQLGLSACLRGDSLSRRQAKVTASAVDLAIEHLQGCPMSVNDKEVTHATLRPGETVLFVGEVLLLCQLRLPALPALKHARITHPYGDPDAADIVGEGPDAYRVRDEATGLGRGTDFVIITGETGTGKTAIARLIHKESSRADGPFVQRNSIVFTTSLLESELFGKIANYPTPGPAVEGALPAADGGTLFLDEVGRLAPAAQGSLLLALEKGTYFRLGESKERKVSFRVVAATNLDRDALQPDFHHRFASDIHLKPLRERQEDIPLLARELLRRRLAKDPSLMRFFAPGADGVLYPRMSGRLVDFLVHHELRGNTRELDGLLAAAIAQSPKGRIEMFADGRASPSARPPSAAPLSEAPPTTKDPVEERLPVTPVTVTAEGVLAALKGANGNQSAAARRLGIQRNKFLRILRELGIEVREEE